MASETSSSAPAATAPVNSPAEPAAPADTGRSARLGLWVLGLGLGGFLLWAAWAPLDEGVPAPAMVTVETKRKAVQHLSGGIVKQVLVQEGQLVREGQPLFRLDEAAAQANFQGVRQRYLGLRAVQARLLAEQAGGRELVVHPDLQAAQSDPLIANQLQSQRSLMQARRDALVSELRGIQEGVEGQSATIRAVVAMQASRQQQRALLQEELGHTRALVAEGYAPRNRQLELERSVAELDAQLADLLGKREQAQRATAELQQRAQLRQHEFKKEVETQLTSVSLEVQSDADRLAAVAADLGRMEIRSPASGQVVGLAIQTVGGVVQPGQKLADVVPEGEPLLLEAQIAPHLIDRVRKGLATDVRFSAFSHAPQLVVQGQVVSVSQDLLTDAQTGVSYYLARVQITEEGVQTLGRHRMQPGMPAEVIVKTGERSLLTYLLNPLTKRVAASMKEE